MAVSYSRVLWSGTPVDVPVGTPLEEQGEQTEKTTGEALPCNTTIKQYTLECSDFFLMFLTVIS